MSAAPKKVNLQEKLQLVNQYWNPAIVGELNESYVKVVKLKGEFIWHHHDNEDELFLVVKGALRMKFRDREETIHPGEFIIVPRGVEHLPIADEAVQIVLVEPRSHLNTGSA